MFVGQDVRGADDAAQLFDKAAAVARTGRGGVAVPLELRGKGRDQAGRIVCTKDHSPVISYWAEVINTGDHRAALRPGRDPWRPQDDGLELPHDGRLF